MAIVVALICQIAIFCCTGVSRRFPINYILLFTFIICEAILVAFTCAQVQNREIVFIAAGMTAGLTLVLTIYAIVRKTDFTVWLSLMWLVLGA